MFGSVEMLAVESAGRDLRGVVVRRKGKKQPVIVDFVSLQAADQADDLPRIEMLRELRERLKYRERGPAVFVTTMARVVEIPMNREKVSQMKRLQLIEAVKWEVEPYTGITGRQAVTGVEVEDLKPAPGEVREETEDVMVHVSVIEQNVYRAINERFRIAGLKLMRIYPPDACFYAPLLSVHDESDRGVLEIGPFFASFALLRGGEPSLINPINLTTDILFDHLEGRESPELVDSLRFILKQAPSPHPVAVTGMGALDDRIVNLIAANSPVGAEPLTLKRSAGLTAAADEESPAFATAAGAAIREASASAKLRSIGVSDAVPASVRLRKSAYLMPLLGAVGVFALLLGHHQMMKLRETSYKKRSAEIKAQIQEKKKDNSKSLALKQEAEDLGKRIATAKKRNEFATREGDRAITVTTRFLDGLGKSIPPEAGLTAIRQDPSQPRKFQVEGVVARAADAGDFAVNLHRSGVCHTVELGPLAVGTGSGGAKSGSGAKSEGASARGFKLMLEAEEKIEEADPS